jgi:hypothetical protein
MSHETKTNSIPLTRVTLYKHGIGHFERRGKVGGPEAIELLCGPDEIDDMLKSLLILNVGGGRLSAVTYESSKTLETRISEFGFDLRNCSGMVDLLRQLKGAPVTVTVAGETVSGRVIGLDQSQQVIGEAVTTEYQLVLYSDSTAMRRIALSSINRLTIDDPALSSEIQQQLELLFQATRKKDRKTLTVELLENTERDVIIAYSIPCPIWKTSYRIVVNEEGKLIIQGMAIVDNVQEEDWNEVQMVLVSAAPVSFIQPLYDPVQPIRPTIDVQGVTSTGPFVAERAQARVKRGMAADMNVPAPMAAPMVRQSIMASVGSAGSFDSTTAFNALAESSVEVQTQETGEMFEYRIKDPVTVPRNSSALIPVVQQTIEGERLSLYNESRNERFPYAALRLKNSTGLTLEAGPVTIMENDAYSGEALLDVVKPDDTRFLPYAIDQGVQVVARTESTRKPIWRVRSWHGALFFDFREQNHRIYEIENITDKDKVVYIEHPTLTNLKLISPKDPAEVTASFYRFRVPIAPKQSHSLDVVEEWDGTQQVRLDYFDAGESKEIRWLIAQNIVDDKFRSFLKDFIERRQEIVKLNQQFRQLSEQLAQYQKDQERARENVKTLGSTSERYRRAIDEAEDKISRTEEELQALTKTVNQKRSEFSAFIAQELTTEIENKES